MYRLLHKEILCGKSTVLAFLISGVSSLAFVESHNSASFISLFQPNNALTISEHSWGWVGALPSQDFQQMFFSIQPSFCIFYNFIPTQLK